MNTIKHIEILKSFVTDQRLKRFDEVIKFRTRYLTVVLENIFQPHNISAVLRTCDLFGVQNVNIIENFNQYIVNEDIALGSNKWLTLIKHDSLIENSLKAINLLKKDGYRIIATTPHTNDVTLNDFDITKGKFALIFGSELPGISDVVKQNADEFIKIPMFGFTESFNISVSAAITLYDITERLRKSKIDWKLTEAEKNDIYLDWLKKTVKDAEKIIEKKLKL